MGRRAETTDYLKNCVADTLLNLMEHRALEHITVSEITARADVGRTTYFRHFDSKTDILTWKLTTSLKNWQSAHPFPREGDRHAQAVWFFTFCTSIQPTLQLLARQKQFEPMLRFFLSVTSPECADSVHSRYQQMYDAFGIMGVMLNWIENGCGETPEQLAEYCAGIQSGREKAEASETCNGHTHEAASERHNAYTIEEGYSL